MNQQFRKTHPVVMFLFDLLVWPLLVLAMGTVMVGFLLGMFIQWLWDLPYTMAQWAVRKFFEDSHRPPR